MSTDAAVPRFGLPLFPPPPRVVGEWLSTRDRDGWPTPPAGEGRPVMLVPGFLAGDTSLTRMVVSLPRRRLHAGPERDHLEHVLHGADGGSAHVAARGRR